MGKVVEEEKFKPVFYGNYLLLDRINVGGMAEVFRAKSRGLAGVERLVAIKRILPHLARDPEFTTMFIDEARIAIHLRHSNIAQIYELDKVGDSLYIAMEYIHGRDLRALINRMRYLGRKIPLGLIAHIIIKVCEGLDYAHRKRDDIGMRDLHIVHRDVSPQNVILSSEGEVKIIDFGIAKATAKENHTRAGILKGKFGYMAPEQVIGHEIDHRADIFCTGILTYELLTRERLFAGSNELSTLRRIRQLEITPPTTLNTDVPRVFEDTVLRALSLRPEDRYSYASELEEDLVKAMQSCGEDIYSSRQLRNFVDEVFGWDLREDQQRLEFLLKRAAELQQESIADALVNIEGVSGEVDESTESEIAAVSARFQDERTNPTYSGKNQALNSHNLTTGNEVASSPFADRRYAPQNTPQFQAGFVDLSRVESSGDQNDLYERANADRGIQDLGIVRDKADWLSERVVNEVNASLRPSVLKSDGPLRHPSREDWSKISHAPESRSDTMGVNGSIMANNSSLVDGRKISMPSGSADNIAGVNKWQSGEFLVQSVSTKQTSQFSESRNSRRIRRKRKRIGLWSFVGGMLLGLLLLLLFYFLFISPMVTRTSAREHKDLSAKNTVVLESRYISARKDMYLIFRQMLGEETVVSVSRNSVSDRKNKFQ